MAKDSGVNESQVKQTDNGAQPLPKKWNAIVGNSGPEEQKEFPTPDFQPNRRERVHLIIWNMC